jgi:hypothetical protein
MKYIQISDQKTGGGSRNKDVIGVPHSSFQDRLVPTSELAHVCGLLPRVIGREEDHVMEIFQAQPLRVSGRIRCSPCVLLVGA